MKDIDIDKLPKNIGFQGFKRIIQKNLPENTPCPYCNVIMERNDKEHLAYISIDHVIPYSQCREHQLNNLMATCRYCNILKSNKNEFKTFNLPKPQKLESEEIEAIHNVIRHEWKILILEEIRSLILIQDFKSIQYYKDNIEFRTGSGDLFYFIGRILNLLIQKNNIKLIKTTIKEFNIKASSISLKELIERIIDLKIDELTSLVNHAKQVSKPIPFKEIQVNAIQKFIEIHSS